MAKIDQYLEPKIGQGEPLSTRITEVLNRDISYSRNKLTDSFKSRLYSDLYVLIDSGIDLATSVGILSKESNANISSDLFKNLTSELTKGRGLADILDQTKGFTLYEVSTIRIGEETGNLPKVLSDLANYFERKVKLKRDLLSAFSYPMVIIAVAIGAVAFMLSFVVPVFQDLFMRMGQDLPWLTIQVIGFSDFIGDYWLIVLSAMTIAALSIRLLWKNESIRIRLESLILRSPVIGALVRNSVLARFSASMGFLLECNVTLVRALDLASSMVDFLPLSAASVRIEQGLIAGDNLETLLEKEALFDSRYTAMMRVGEEVNQLSTVFKHLGNRYADNLERSTKNLTTFIEPVMIGLVGVLVGVILIAMYLPLFDVKGAF